ncbi:DUF262 domain-containing protein [Flavobacterium psychrophilum]|uniref:DUF262 domain-containing protein n=1 Tax=Flavobacterium psychrophilum TaxID=96345 RepID=UPI000A3BDAE9|nr:DUF262 domain-containing protein [Flavobacterium psychrophilum]EKT4550709.1 DUF262 domain-containing protein [Flavobacterium psychrophilum]ELM3645204.1 DUF262 domain-containing protein [Flavobacterium psychrophilum]ELY2018498.1 DUF262 domain-containing protein [Flavobacterium psychrophilum]OUD24854.1 hypothetical protein FPG92_12500 [Flavobacterium psychrophilum]
MASIKIKDFFNGRFFEIPKYQRGYAWEIQNIRELFEDVVESIESNSNHYIGTIVLSKSEDDDEKFYVVDGQQRITTTTLIIGALIKKLTEKDQAYYERFYLKEDERYRLTPLNRDCKFLTNLLDSKVGEPQNKSQRYLKEAYEEIKFKVEKIDDKLKFLKSVEKLEVMEFVENSEGDAIRIFQTVNDRGKPLSNMEKAKSLLIYFSNRYLDKKLDNQINDCFSDIFEIYDDIKHLGEELNITLIKNKEFNEDNLMRYHFVSYSDENYDPTASYVLQFLKNKLTNFRNTSTTENYQEIEDFINSYTESLKSFFENCKNVIERAKTEPKYFKLFVVLNLSATLYPLIVKLESLKLLDKNLETKNYEKFTFYDLIELIEVRVYKTRATDPKADISRLVFDIDKKSPIDIQNWLLWFNGRWMSKEEFQSRMYGWIFGNRALNHIFINYSESLQKKEYKISELIAISNKNPNIEHILAQTPTFAPRALGFKNKEDFIDFEHNLGNLTILERSLNSSIQNKSAIDKVEAYGKSTFIMTKMIGSEIDTKKTFTKTELNERTKLIAEYCLERWWC